MTIHLHTMATARARCAELGITAARSLAETVERIKAKEAEMQRDAYRAAHPEIAAEGAKLCDCDPVGDAAREHYQGLGKQPCDCQPEADYSGIEARVLAHMAEDGAISPDLAQAIGYVPPGGVGGRGDALRWVRSRPRQDVGTVRAFMVPVNGGARHKGGGARPAISYRAGRRNLAKQMRKSARKAAAHLVPA